MKIGAVGCSNSSFVWGNPWHHFVGIKYNADIISGSSTGAGNEMNIDKMRIILQNNKLDYFIVQVTEPSRFVIGIENYMEELNTNEINPAIGEKGLHGHNRYQDLAFYTFNGRSNDENLERLFGRKFNVDDFFINHVFTSNFNTNNKVFHTLLTMKALCDSYNVKVLFFSWFVELFHLAKKCGYYDVIKNFNICEGTVYEYMCNNDIKPLPDGHFDSLGHEKLVNGYLVPFLDQHLK